jgi:hypothetical protein
LRDSVKDDFDDKEKQDDERKEESNYEKRKYLDIDKDEMEKGQVAITYANDNDEKEYIVDHIAGCCQAFRKDLSIFGFKLDTYYGKFWVEDTDLSMQSLELNKIIRNF